MSIVRNIFKDMLPGLFDNLEIQGITRRSEGMMPNIAGVEMFGGKEMAANVGKEFGITPKMLDEAAADWSVLKPQEWKDKYGQLGLTMDVNAKQAMMEIPDDAVRLLKGKNPFDPDQFEAGKTYGINEIAKTDLLNKAYPTIEDIKVVFKDDTANPNSKASFSPTKEGGILTINRAAPEVQQDGIVPSMLHEIQHYVQGRELLTQGEDFRLRLQDYPDYNLATSSMQKTIGSKQLMADAKKLANETGISQEKLFNALSDLAMNPGRDTKSQLAISLGNGSKVKEIIQNAEKLPALRGFLEDKNMAKEAVDSAFSDYINVAGEAFARATANRRKLTMPERIKQTVSENLDVPFSTLTPSKAGAYFENMRQTQNPAQNELMFTDPTQSTIQGL